MENLIMLSLAAAVLLAAVAGARGQQPQPPQIIYVQQVAPEEPRGSGCLPLLVLLGVVLGALFLLPGL
jgi:hypothetical protein